MPELASLSPRRDRSRTIGRSDDCTLPRFHAYVCSDTLITRHSLPGPPLSARNAITELRAHNVTVAVGVNEAWMVRNTRFDVAWVGLRPVIVLGGALTDVWRACRRLSSRAGRSPKRMRSRSRRRTWRTCWGSRRTSCRATWSRRVAETCSTSARSWRSCLPGAAS